ncbi:MAG: M16 family metallopeptidase [Bacteroidota bacterium]
MVKFEKYVLNNGLKVIAHQDKSTPMAAFNVLYNVGSKDEHPEHTGMAHLFEHLMFEGSENVKEFDVVLQNAGGENNAFTNNDITNYYLSLPVKNIETAFFIESDRMLKPAFSAEKLSTQKKVVVEEFKQSYLNQPYGDLMMLLREMAYTKHPYQWPTIGKNIEHIEKTQIQHVKEFFNKFYKPDNAVLAVAGNISPQRVFQFAEKWFGDLSQSKFNHRELPVEPEQFERRFRRVERDVPYDEIYIAFHMPDRLSDDYYGLDLISDILANGNSSRLYEKLIKGKQMFSEVNAWITGSLDPGMLVVSGRVPENQSIIEAEKELFHIIAELREEKPSENELQKVKNKIRSVNAFANMSVLSKAMNLAYYEYLGDAALLNMQNQKYFEVNTEDIQRLSNKYLRPEKASVLHYCKKQDSI